MTTIYERNILEHYYTSNDPYKNGSENWNNLDIETVNNFIKLGLLIETIKDGQNKIVSNEMALALYFDAVGDVPFPVLKWSMP